MSYYLIWIELGKYRPFDYNNNIIMKNIFNRLNMMNVFTNPCNHRSTDSLYIKTI